MTFFKFCRHKGGSGAFATITLESVRGTAGDVEWAPASSPLKKFYSDAVSEGVRDALSWHESEGGEAAVFRVLDLQEFLVDTRPDAVRCAATMAAWKELGHEEAGIVFDFDGEWRARRAGETIS